MHNVENEIVHAFILGRQRQADDCEFEASLVYIANSRAVAQ